MQTTIRLQKTKETKRFIRYDAKDDTAAVPTVYVRKSAVGDAQEVELTLSLKKEGE